MIENLTYSIKIHNILNKEECVITKKVTLQNYKEHFITIFNHINKLGEYTCDFDNNKCKISMQDKIINKGYIFNTSKTINKTLYELSLINIDNELDNLFIKSVQSQTETESSELKQSVQSQTETETESLELKQSQEHKTKDVLSQRKINMRTFCESEEYSYLNYNKPCFVNYYDNQLNDFLSCRNKNETLIIKPISIIPYDDLVKELKIKLNIDNFGLKNNNNKRKFI